MIFRTATIDDIKDMQRVRNAVKENRLSDPALVTDEDYVRFLTQRGKGWVCIIHNQVAGFTIVDLEHRNVWALFLHPDFERRGIGKRLQTLMLDWYFSQTKDTIGLGTAPETRAEAFYRRSGWVETGILGKELQFEMTYDSWMAPLK